MYYTHVQDPTVYTSPEETLTQSGILEKRKHTDTLLYPRRHRRTTSPTCATTHKVGLVARIIYAPFYRGTHVQLPVHHESFASLASFP